MTENNPLDQHNDKLYSMLIKNNIVQILNNDLNNDMLLVDEHHFHSVA